MTISLSTTRYAYHQDNEYLPGIPIITYDNEERHSTEEEEESAPNPSNTIKR